MKILCATDFSPPARAALDLAVYLARAWGDSVHLLHVVEYSPELGLEAPSPHELLLDTFREQAEGNLAREVQRAHHPELVITTEVTVGGAAEEVRLRTHGDDVRMVVMGSHGRKRHAASFLGSVAESATHDAACPVLVTRGLADPGAAIDGLRRPRMAVLVDGSPAAQAALAFCQSLRTALPCDVTFVQPYAPHDEDARFGLDENEVGGAPVDLRQLLDRELRRWVGQLPGQGEVQFRLVAREGDKAEAFAEEAARTQADLAIVGLAQRRLIPGRSRHAGKMLRLMSVPVICVPEAGRAPAQPRPGAIPIVRKVLVGTDLSDFSNQAIAAAYAMLSAGGGEVEICHVFERGVQLTTEVGLAAPLTLSAGSREELLARLGRLAPPEAAARGIATRLAVIEAAAAPDGLLHEAERFGADLVVVASHGRTGLGRAIMGSVASELVRRGGRPILVLHPPLR
jgi:nucleotide-binding universal stress UspA family protein